MFKGLLWYVVLGAVLLFLLAIARSSWAGNDTATFEWLPNEPAPDGYAIIWGYPHRHYLTRVEYPDPEIVDGTIKRTVTDLPDETVFMQLVAYLELPGGNCSPTRLDSQLSHRITRYVGPPINPKIPQDGKVDGVTK